MLTMASLARPTGYGIRTWLALRAVRTVQGAHSPAPILLCFESLRDWVRPEAHRRIRASAARLRAVTVCLPLFPARIPGSTWLNVAWVAFWARVLMLVGRVGVVHGQSHMAAGAATLALLGVHSRRLVFDVHGVDIEEAVADGRIRAQGRVHRFRLALERAAIRRADWILAVSSGLEQHVRGRAVPGGRVPIVPCVSSLPLPSSSLDSCRDKTRARLGWPDAPVVLYLGGASPWQDPTRIVGAFVAARTLDARLRLLVITPDVAAFRRLLAAAQVPASCYAVEAHPHDDVASVAAAADVGLLLRDGSLVNRVASPTKFAEYLSVGVPVVLTEVLADFARIARSEDVGAVLSPDASPLEIARAILSLASDAPEARAERRSRAQRVALQQLAFGTILSTYTEIYGTSRA